MKKYDSPVCEVITLMTSDILTASTYNSIGYSDNGNMDDGGFPDIYMW